MRGAPDRTVATVTGDLGLDSMAVTAAGKLCIGTIWTGWYRDRRSSRRACGAHIVPRLELVTNIAFGGEDMRTAYITLSGADEFIRTRWPEPGLKLSF